MIMDRSKYFEKPDGGTPLEAANFKRADMGPSLQAGQFFAPDIMIRRHPVGRKGILSRRTRRMERPGREFEELDTVREQQKA